MAGYGKLIAALLRSDQGQAGNSVVATSGNVANAVANATLPAVAGKTNYLSGFEVTSTGATAAGIVVVTAINLIGGVTLSYVLAVVAGATLGNTPLVVQFDSPIAANAVNLAITVSCPALGAGNTNCVVNAHGYLV